MHHFSKPPPRFVCIYYYIHTCVCFAGARKPTMKLVSPFIYPCTCGSIFTDPKSFILPSLKLADSRMKTFFSLFSQTLPPTTPPSPPTVIVYTRTHIGRGIPAVNYYMSKIDRTPSSPDNP